MKKLITGLLAAFLMSAGLVAFTSTSPASAICGNAQYPACYQTTTTIKATPAAAGPKRRVFTVKTKATGTNAAPVGKISFTFRRNGKIVSSTTRVADKTVTLARTFGKKGRYNVTARYISRSGTIFLSSKPVAVSFVVR